MSLAESFLQVPFSDLKFDVYKEGLWTTRSTLISWDLGFCLSHDVSKSSKSYVNTNSNFFQTGTLTEDGLDLWGTVPTVDNW